MSGAQIAAEVNAALAEASIATGDGVLTVTLLQPAVQPMSPWDSPAGAPIEHEVNAVISDYPLSMIDDTLIRQGDKRIMVSATGPAPKVNWRVISGGVNYAILRVREIGPGGVALYYELQARV
ncbi:hypothetical protein UFOVP317_29 [uncultured Caudovirales phage]|uniref:Head-tail joining protein n=1 Tax=uncultured Caudovirales phage TaxID=2100421 RepID=A0A6J5LWB1_9CAUD|nr:hypothetical protein UFOVP317_29 [uncultured Caudovirales phage]